MIKQIGSTNRAAKSAQKTFVIMKIKFAKIKLQAAGRGKWLDGCDSSNTDCVLKSINYREWFFFSKLFISFLIKSAFGRVSSDQSYASS